jgi:hypothetical protein
MREKIVSSPRMRLRKNQRLTGQNAKGSATPLAAFDQLA